jgi:hypothetical protein
MQGGWVYRPVITEYETFLFYNAMRKHRDAFYYAPIAVAKREETGMKYRFLCIAAPKACPYSQSLFADIEIYKPVDGMPYATCLYRQEYGSMFPQRFY